MAEKIELQIVADNSDYITKTRQVEQATTSMHNTVRKQYTSEKGLIEGIIEDMDELKKRKSKAYSTEEIAAYNKSLESYKKQLKELDKAGLKVEETTKKQTKATNLLWDSVKKLAAAYLTVNAAIKVFNAIMNSTQQTGDLLKREMTGLKFSIDELSRSVAQGNWSDLGKRLAEARRAGIEYSIALDNIGDRERELQLEEIDRAVIMSNLAKIYRNTALVGVEGYKKRAAAAEEYIKIAEEGEAAAVDLLKIRLNTELAAARQMMGYSEDITDAKKDEINQEIINNIKSAKIFEENKDQLIEYKRLQSELTKARAGTPTFEYFGEVLVETGRTIDQNKIGELEKQIASLDTGVADMSKTYEKWGAITDPVRIKITNALEAIGKKEVEVSNSTIRANTMAEFSGLMLAKEEGKALDDRKKKLEEFLQATMALEDQYEKDRIDRLEGPERFAADRDYQVKQLAMLRTHLESMGDLTEAHIKWLASLEESANIDFLKKSVDYDQKAFDEMVGYGDKVRELERKLQEEALDLIEDNEKEKLKLQIKFAEEDIKILQAIGSDTSQAEIAILKQRIAIWNNEINKEEGGSKTIWDIFGLGDNPEAQDAIKQGIAATTDALDEIFDARVADAQRTRELLDTQISETQRSLESEIELAKLGYANNVDAKRKELEALKTQREKALKEEEKALKAQRAMDTAMQVTSLITATANIIKGYSKLPVIGQVLAIAAIASMFAAFAAAKVQAASAAKLAEGGTGTDTGMIKGRTHQQGGERFLDHVEVERGEMWGVLSQKATQKYGKQFNQVVTSFNKDRMPVMQTASYDNNIIVDVNQTNERLDKVEYQLVKLNRHFAGQDKVIETATARIEKRGNRTRIVRK